MRQLTVILGGLLLASLLAACGQKGDLYLPDPPAQSSSAWSSSAQSHSAVSSTIRNV